jgi:hypothetical protein
MGNELLLANGPRSTRGSQAPDGCGRRGRFDTRSEALFSFLHQRGDILGHRERPAGIQRLLRRTDADTESRRYAHSLSAARVFRYERRCWKRGRLGTAQIIDSASTERSPASGYRYDPERRSHCAPVKRHRSLKPSPFGATVSCCHKRAAAALQASGSTQESCFKIAASPYGS